MKKLVETEEGTFYISEDKHIVFIPRQGSKRKYNIDMSISSINPEFWTWWGI